MPSEIAHLIINSPFTAGAAFVVLLPSLFILLLVVVYAAFGGDKGKYG